MYMELNCIDKCYALNFPVKAYIIHHCFSYCCPNHYSRFYSFSNEGKRRKGRTSFVDIFRLSRLCCPISSLSISILHADLSLKPITH